MPFSWLWHAVKWRSISFQVVKNSLADITAEREVPHEDQIPQKTSTDPLPWKTLPKLSYGPNKKYPHLSKAVEVKHYGYKPQYLLCNSVQVKSSTNEGRYMVAKQKIVPGDVLMVDTAYSTSMFEGYYPTHCNLCFIRLKEDCVPCPTCNTVSFNLF